MSEYPLSNQMNYSFGGEKIRLIRGNCLEKMPEIPAETVQCVVTSPPYFGLRDYGVDGQIGHEKTPEEFVEKMVEVFRHVHRVLRKDGVLWLNLGDSYAGNRQSPGQTDSRRRDNAVIPRNDLRMNGLKCKDLVGIPWRVAFALQADGWYLRQDIIWHKPNPMPESVKDRCTKAHEYLFLLAKSEKYFFNQEAMEEPGVIPAGVRAAKGSNVRSELKDVNGRPPEYWEYTGTRNKRSVWSVNTKPYKGAHFATFPPELITPCVLAGSRPGDTVLDPFNGSGTTGAVAFEYGRKYIGIELNQDYIDLSLERFRCVNPRLMEITAGNPTI